MNLVTMEINVIKEQKNQIFLVSFYSGQLQTITLKTIKG